MKPILFTSFAVLLSTSTSSAALSFSLQFANPFGDGVLAGIADSSGGLASGLSWGILIAETGNDFSSPLSTQLGISTSDGSELASGLRFFEGGVTTALTFGNDPGEGVIGNSGTIDASPFEPGINSGDAFAVVWFDRGISAGDTLQPGDNYGVLTNPNFVVPGDGASFVPFGSNFNGADPLRSASLVVIPEPTSVLLLSLSSLILLKRRRSS